MAANGATATPNGTPLSSFKRLLNAMTVVENATAILVIWGSEMKRREKEKPRTLTPN